MKDIVLRELTFAYEGKKVFEHLNARFPAGAITVLGGRSGGGKTTLLRLLCGLEKAPEGSIDGLSGLRAGVLFQEDRLCLNLSATANLRMVLAPVTRSSAELTSFLHGHLCKIGLADCLEMPVREFSGGMKRRVALLRALLAPADYLLLDEPFQGLDAESKTSALDAIRTLRNGRSLILVSHDPDDAGALGAAYLNLFQ